MGDGMKRYHTAFTDNDYFVGYYIIDIQNDYQIVGGIIYETKEECEKVAELMNEKV